MYEVSLSNSISLRMISSRDFFTLCSTLSSDINNAACALAMCCTVTGKSPRHMSISSMIALMDTFASGLGKSSCCNSVKKSWSMFRLFNTFFACLSLNTCVSACLVIFPSLFSNFFKFIKIDCFASMMSASSFSACATALTTSQSTPISIFMTVIAEKRMKAMNTTQDSKQANSPENNIAVKTEPVLSMKVPSMRSVHIVEGIVTKFLGASALLMAEFSFRNMFKTIAKV
mmetsp:Transcript_56311/g.98346  ORF Transcript_56311/g.98346 Transcript_56311/m.98346 type:complete len:230 (-) Transcript_56311:12-701(-)